MSSSQPEGTMVALLRDSNGLSASAENTRALPPEPLVLDTSQFQELLETLGGDLDIVVAIYRTFLVTAVTLIGDLPDQDCAAQAATLHTLKGSASLLGAMRIVRLAAHLERVAAKSVHPVVKARIEELTGELSVFRAAINAHVRSFEYRPEL